MSSRLAFTSSQGNKEDEERPSSECQQRRDILERYLLQLEQRPLLTRCLTCAAIGGLGALIGARTIPKNRRKPPTIDWLDVLSFTIHGGLVSGPISHYWTKLLEQHFFDSRSQAMMIDQVIAQPAQLFLMFIYLDMSRAALQAIPSAVSRSSSKLGAAVGTSWKFWPVSVYLMLRVLKRKKHYVAVMNLCSIAWMAHLAKRRTRRDS